MIIPKNGKQEKQKIKKHYHVNKLQKRMREYDRNLPEDEKIMKKHYANNRNKHISDEEKKRRYGKLLLPKQNLLDHLINSVEEIENVGLNK